jgi:hypothetical protein
VFSCTALFDNFMSNYHRNDDDGPLGIGIEGKELVIRVGLGRLKWCLRNDDGPMRACTIRSKVGMAKDIARAAMKDDEQGLTPVANFLDEMAQAAAENGSEHILSNRELDGKNSA